MVPGTCTVSALPGKIFKRLLNRIFNYYCFQITLFLQKVEKKKERKPCLYSPNLIITYKHNIIIKIDSDIKLAEHFSLISCLFPLLFFFYFMILQFSVPFFSFNHSWPWYFKVLTIYFITRFISFCYQIWIIHYWEEHYRSYLPFSVYGTRGNVVSMCLNAHLSNVLSVRFLHYIITTFCFVKFWSKGLEIMHISCFSLSFYQLN